MPHVWEFQIGCGEAREGSGNKKDEKNTKRHERHERHEKHEKHEKPKKTRKTYNFSKLFPQFFSDMLKFSSFFFIISVNQI